jgi:hypothetical protein
VVSVKDPYGRIPEGDVGYVVTASAGQSTS